MDIETIINFAFTPASSPIDILFLYVFGLGLISLILSITTILTSNIRYLDDIKSRIELQIKDTKLEFERITKELLKNEEIQNKIEIQKQKERVGKTLEKLQLFENVMIGMCTLKKEKIYNHFHCLSNAYFKFIKSKSNAVLLFIIIAYHLFPAPVLLPLIFFWFFCNKSLFKSFVDIFENTKNLLDLWNETILHKDKIDTLLTKFRYGDFTDEDISKVINWIKIT